jgi:hypothetical protein
MIHETGWFVEFNSSADPITGEIAVALIPTIIIEGSDDCWAIGVAFLCWSFHVGRAYG